MFFADELPFRKGILHKIKPKMYNAFLCVARQFAPIQAKQDLSRLKEVRDAKRRKDDLALKAQSDKASEAYADLLFLHNMHVDGKCWTLEDMVHED